MSCCRPHPASEMLNACPPHESEYRGVVPEVQSSQSVSYSDASIHREHSQVAGLEQEGYSNGSGQRWSESGQEGSPNVSFRSHYSGFNERSLVDDMMWHSREEVQTFVLWISLCACFHAGFCRRSCVVTVKIRI